MKLYIPDVGHKITLEQPWAVGIQHEDRNRRFLQVMKANGGDDVVLNFGAYRDWLPTSDKRFTMILPAGTVLLVDRVYIRKGSSDFSSLSFFVESCPLLAFTHKKLGGTSTRKLRFFASLADVNTMIIVDPED